MSSATAASIPATVKPLRRRMLTVPAMAGLIYTASWLAGLAVAPSSTSVRSAGAEVVAGYAGHEGAAAAQFLLTEGAASLALAVVAITVGRAGLRAGAGRSAWLTLGTGAAAAAIAMVQCALGLYLTLSVIPAGHASAAAALSEAINRLDGVKMFLLAAMAVAGTVMARRTGLLPRWLMWTGVALAIAITTSGIGYAFLNNTFALAAWLSLPLLLAWVTGAGIVLGRAAQAGRDISCRVRA
jgi:hypothetical protein